ncbi:hypothetical protein [Xylanimonas sp. McL0601]|uniref:hypothetical protein n=1 Tax=Xylanimonas sp. McL0601 TaxID=3414739 RepID=UPI003CEFCA1A
MPTPPRLILARDHDRNTLRRGMATGALARVRRGAYKTTTTPSVSHATSEDALARIHAVHAQLRAAHAFSHASAALLWDLRLWQVPDVTHVRQRSRASGERAADIVRHFGLPETSVEIDGIPVTSLLQTVFECLLTMHPLAGLVVADSALEGGFRSADALELLRANGRRNGSARAALLLELADGGAESAWETWLRYVALRLGLPRPCTQFPVSTHLGVFRVDLAWPEQRVLAEFDGQVKYVDGAFGPGYDGRRALLDEKRREDAIVETLGVRPLRVVAADARDVDRLSSRLLARFPGPVRTARRPLRLLTLP